MQPRAIALATAAVGFLGPMARARADQAVQVSADAVLTGRAVSTFSGGAVVPWTVGVDRNDGLMTAAAEAFLKQTGVALPDDGRFAADARHPEIVLHFSNTAPATSPQTAAINDVGSLDVAIPPASYSRLFLVMTAAANGASPTGSPVTLTLTYADATTTTASMTWPDYGTGAPLPADPPGFFNLIWGMHKWSKDQLSVDTPTHALTGLELVPDAGRKLVGLRVNKLDTGKVLVFWGLTGLATNVVDGSSDASDAGDETGDGSDAGSSGSAEGGTGGGLFEGGTTDTSKDSSPTEGSAGARAPADASNGAGCGCVVARRPARSEVTLGALLATMVLARRRRSGPRD